MKLLTQILLGIVVSLCAHATLAVEKNEPTQGKKSTHVSFDELLIQGQYHFSDEAVITVEQDKLLDALLAVRKDFKDRLEQSVDSQ